MQRHVDRVQGPAYAEFKHDAPETRRPLPATAAQVCVPPQQNRIRRLQ
jgi:hypothetical protein